MQAWGSKNLGENLDAIIGKEVGSVVIGEILM